MPRFAANLSMLYPELDFLDRFDAAAKDGFDGVEYLFPYAFPAAEIAARLKANGLKQVLFNAPPGNWDGGERGLACLPGRENEFRDGIAKAGSELARARSAPASRRPTNTEAVSSIISWRGSGLRHQRRCARRHGARGRSFFRRRCGSDGCRRDRR